jgi:L-amino acid N-acyltransferase YncA
VNRTLKIRQLEKKDYKAYKRLFLEAYKEYLEFLKLKNQSQYEMEKQEKRTVSRERFNFYLNSGSSFAAEEKGKVIGYVASQTISFMHGVDKLFYSEYIVVEPEFRRRGTATALMQRLIDYARQNGADRVYSTINPDNEASIRLHEKAGFNVRSWKVASFRKID